MKNSINLIFCILLISCSTPETDYHKGLTKVWQIERLRWNASSLTLNDDNLYGSTLDKTIFRLDFKTGNLIWESQSSTSYAGQKPLVTDSQIFIGGSDVLASYDHDGNLIWSNKVGNKIGHSIIEFDSLIFASLTGKGLNAFDKSEGKNAWKIEPEYQMFSTSNPVIQDSIIILGNFDYSRENNLDHTTAINAKNGETICARRNKHYITGTGLFLKDKVYICYDSSYSKGIIRALDVRNGSTLWEVVSQPECHYKPIVFNSHLLIPSYDRSLDYLDLESGELVWSLNSDDLIPATELVEFKNKVYYGSVNRKLISVDSTGNSYEISEFEYGIGDPIIFKDDLYIPDGSGNLFEVNNMP